MQDTVQRPLIDVSSDRPGAAFALVLALLAVPGSTIAWSLPAGGLWIGLPLGVAAIVLALRARRQGVGTGMATVAIVIGALAIGQMVVWTIVSALS
jgi:hypothetical protein